MADQSPFVGNSDILPYVQNIWCGNGWRILRLCITIFTKKVRKPKKIIASPVVMIRLSVIWAIQFPQQLEI